MITMGVGLHGLNGTGDWTGGNASGTCVRCFQCKKRFGIGPRAGPGGTYIPLILKVLGISADSAATLVARRASRRDS